MHRPAGLALLPVAGLFLALALACGKGSDTAPPEAPEGTFRDTACGLVWQQAAGPALLWPDAIDHCEGLDLAGQAWRLPTIGELRCLVNGCEDTAVDGACEVSDECTGVGCTTTACEGCEPASGAIGCYFSGQLEGGCDDPYWSASPVTDELSWVLHFRDAGISHDAVGEAHAVRCVTDG